VKDPVIGVWAGAGTPLLVEVHGVPLLRLTCRRIGFGLIKVLIPWPSELDHLEAAAKDWKLHAVRCHADERIAMRDTVADYRPDVGMVIQGMSADIDTAEVKLAFARLNAGFERYESKRIRAYPAATWLGISDSEDGWNDPVRDQAETRKLFPPTGLDLDTRYLTRTIVR
jgi:hypothetical protein